MKKNLMLMSMMIVLLAGCAGAPLPPITAGTGAQLEQDEQRLWRRSAEEQKKLDESGYLYEDAELERYVNGVAKKIMPPDVFHAIPFRIRIVGHPYLNAFALPHGAVYIHTAMLARMENEAQLAALLGHEMAHSTHRHGIQKWRKFKSASARSAALAVTIGGTPIIGGIFTALGDVGSMASLSGYSKGFEDEADAEGLRLMVKAGYDPRESVTLFEIMKQYLEDEDIKEPFFFGSHPRTKDRIKNLSRLLKNEYKDVKGGKTNTELFQRMTARVILDNARLDLQAGRFDTARKGAERYLVRKPNSAEGLYLTGEVYRQRNDKDDIKTATNYYRKAIAASSRYAEPYRALGLLQFKNGDKKNAKENFTKYLSLAPNAPDREYIAEYVKQCK